LIVDVDYGYMQLQDWVIVNIRIIDSAEVAIAYTNTGEANGRTQWEIALLELTQPNGTFDYIYASVENEAHNFTALIQECLNRSDFDGFMHFVQIPHANIRRSDFVSDDWDEKDFREITVTSIRQTGAFSWRVDFECVLTLASGNRFAASSFYEIEYDPGEGRWLIINMDYIGFIGRSSRYWTATS
jgi:hypothetical protein